MLGRKQTEEIDCDGVGPIAVESDRSDGDQALDVGMNRVAMHPLPAGIVAGGITHLAVAAGQPLHVAIEQRHAHGGGGINAQTATKRAGEAARQIGSAALAGGRAVLHPRVEGLVLGPRPWGMGHSQQEKAPARWQIGYPG